VQNFAERLPDDLIEKRDALTRTLKDINAKIQNLLSMAERGVHLESIAIRIEELEMQKHTIEDNLSLLEKRHILLNCSQDEIQRQVTRFLKDFDKGFEEMSLQDKKAAMRRFVDMIIVDRRERKVKCYLRMLPSLGPIGSLDPKPILGSIGSLNGNRTRI
jgi:hypothetical protein